MRRTLTAYGGILILLLLLTMSGCRSHSSNEKKDDPDNVEIGTTEEKLENSGSTEEGTDEDPVEKWIQTMSIKEKVGQLFLIRPESLDSSKTAEQVHASSRYGVTEMTEGMRKMLAEYPVGGVVLFGKNIEDSVQLTDFISSWQKESKIPMFVSVDEEGGQIARLANHKAFALPKYESAAAVASSGNSVEALTMGDTIGGYLKKYGFNMDFAPVADVNTNPDNPIIGTRAFSSDAAVVAKMASAMATGLKHQDIIPIFKHFPGHGDTAEDSHTALAVSYKTREEMEECEWIPYQKLTDQECVMVGHIAVPEITGNLTPATMSEEVVTGILRKDLEFDGVVLTDSLAMQAITDEYSSGKAAIHALQAGCDVLLMPYDFQEAFDAVVDAVEDGRISESRLNDSVARILRLKYDYGLLGQ